MKKYNQPAIMAGLLIVIFFHLNSFVWAKDLISADKALKKVFSQATHFDPERIVLSDEQRRAIEEEARISFEKTHSPEIYMYTARQDDQILGYAFEDVVVGKWGPIHYLVGLDPQGTVLQVIILDYKEIRGKPIAKKRFLKQYKKKTRHDPVKLRRDIDGVTGATISSRSLTDGIRKLLYVFDSLRKVKTFLDY